VGVSTSDLRGPPLVGKMVATKNNDPKSWLFQIGWIKIIINTLWLFSTLTSKHRNRM